MGNPPNVSGIGPTWYVDANWTGTITPAVTTAQTAYNNALANLQNLQQPGNKPSVTDAYNSAKSTLESVLADSNSTAAQIKAAKDAFDAAQQTYNSDLSALETATDALVKAQYAASSAVDSGVDTKFASFLTQLQGVMDKALTLDGTATLLINGNDAYDQFSTDDKARVKARTDFYNALAKLFTLTSSQSPLGLQDQLNEAVNTLQQDQDDLLLARGQKAYDAAQGNDTTADQAAIDALTGKITTQTATVNSLITQRNSALSTLKSDASAYQDKIALEESDLQAVAGAMQTAPTAFLQDLENARQAATAAENLALSSAQIADTLAQTTHKIDFPTDNPIIDALVQEIYNEASILASGLSTSSLTAPVQVTSQIQLPTLPPPGHMSMTQLMQFITLAEVILQELVNEIRRADAALNELRLGIFNAAGSADATSYATQQQWANTLYSADVAYDNQVSTDNTNNVQTTVGELQFIKDNAAQINAVINQTNSDILAQNTRGKTVVTDYNSAVQMTTDDYKLQLWSDQGKLQSFADQLGQIILQKQLPSTDPLQTVYSDILSVIGDLNTISKDLSTVPVASSLSDDQTQLTTDQGLLTTALTNLPTQDSETQAVLTSILGNSSVTGFIDIVSSDQSLLILNLQGATDTATQTLNTQVSSESTLLTSYSLDVSDIINSLASGDPNIAKLTTMNTDISTVMSDLDTVAQDLVATNINLTTLSTHTTKLNDDLATLQKDRNKVSDNAFTSTQQLTLTSIDETMQDISNTIVGLTAYTTPPTSTATTPPTLPGHVQTPLMAAPTQLSVQIPDINASSITIPPTLQNVSFPPAPPIPATPDPGDVQTANDEVHQLNQILAPLIPRLKAAGLDMTALDPLFIRSYIPIRQPSSTLDFNTLITVILYVIVYILEAEIIQKATQSNPTQPSNFLSASALLGNPNIMGIISNVQGIGSGVGLGSANLFSSSSNIAASLNAVFSSSSFINYVQGIFQQAGLVSALTALSNLPTTPTSTATGTPATTTPTALPTLTTAEQSSLQAGITELVTAISNVPQLKSNALASLQSLGQQNASDDELKQLLSFLIFLQQLLALLVAALAVAAGQNVTNIDHIVQQAFPSAANAPLTNTAGTLNVLGVTAIPPGITPSNPTFLPTFFNAVTPILPPTTSQTVTRQVTQVFASHGITLNTTSPLGTAIHTALTTTNPSTAAAITPQLHTIAQHAGTTAVQTIVNNPANQPTIATNLNTATTTALSALTPTQISSANTVLAGIPQAATLPTNLQNVAVVALGNGIITPDQAKGFVNELLSAGSEQTNPTIATILGSALQGLPTYAASGEPGQLPDALSQVVNAFKTLSKQTDDSTFTQQAVTLFAHFVRDQSNYYTRSLSLILDPAKTYVKNFSIVTRQTTGHDALGPTTQIPIAG